MAIAVRTMKSKDSSIENEDEEIRFKTGARLYFMTLIFSLAAAIAVMWGLFSM